MTDSRPLPLTLTEYIRKTASFFGIQQDSMYKTEKHPILVG